VINAIRFFLALVALAAGSAFGADANVTVLTGRGNSLYYVFGVSVAEAIGQALPGLKTTVRGTKGSAENLALLEAGRGDLGFASGDSLTDAWQGNAEAGFKTPLSKLRGVAAIYPDYIQILARADTGIRSLDDLKGKHISVGAPRSPIELNARRIFAAAGLSYESFGKVEYFPFGESVEMMKDARIDAMLQSAAPGALGVRDLANALDIVVVPIPREVVARIDNAAYEPGAIPAHTYRGQPEDVPVAALRNYLVTREDADPELVYAMTRAFWESLDRLRAIHSAAKAIEIKDALHGMPVPLHPGAEKYYREIKLLAPAPKQKPTRRRG
jgi:TRAP transporter TAXI family solute receptor